MGIEENLHNRKWLYKKLRAEIIGPDPTGAEIDIKPDAKDQKFTWEDFRKPKKQKNGEEILWQDSPAKRYGAGILYPIGVVEEIERLRPNEANDSQEIEMTIDSPPENQDKKEQKITGGVDDSSDDYDVTLANAFKPSAIGISFLANFSIETQGFYVEIVNVGRLSSSEYSETSAAIYKRVGVHVGDNSSSQPNNSLWLRFPLVESEGAYPKIFFSADELLSARSPIRKKIELNGALLEILVVVRGGYSRITRDQKLITVSLLNKKNADEGRVDELCIFQSGIRVKGSTGKDWIDPYPETELTKSRSGDESTDEMRNSILYRQYQTFAIGHGSAVDWHNAIPEKVSEVWTDVLPTYETPNVSADLFITGDDGSKIPLKVSMRKLAGLDPEDDGFRDLDTLVEAYSKWIDDLKTPRSGIVEIPKELTLTAVDLIKKCEDCRDRIVSGINFLKGSTDDSRFARQAFKLANHAMLIAQLRATSEVRRPSQESNNSTVTWMPSISNIDPSLPSEKGYWRAFQIAFLLMSVEGIVDPTSPERETVDLIWFPTGGGKTEAYLGLSAFTILFNRISDNSPAGADVLMRYTLRLLTAQQFQRAALLFCALEVLRKTNIAALGNESFRIGLWVGGSTTPNTRKDALSALSQLERDRDSVNPFVLLKCPWCGAAFGPSNDDSNLAKGKFRKSNYGSRQTLFGYKRYKTSELETVVFRCGDPACEFGDKPFSSEAQFLPIVIIDEDLIEAPPNLIIGTVDKFAMLAWKPSLRSIFGIGGNGRHKSSPPTLIIQDELHLISGPLGSMVGAYETVIERLCIDDFGGVFKPKIIASTATISRAFEQIRNLYARKKTFLFPPSGLEASDSFFSREDKDDSGNLKPGRLYVGVLAPAHGSLQTTESRVFATLLQQTALMQTDDLGRDPWWTLLCFFNSIRELGSAASLFVSDTRDYLRVILDRYGVKYDSIRKLFEVTELTSRIRSDQVPKELERLEKTYNSSVGASQEAVDACLASNIIEVGVDISRLSLMAIIGQPKTTSQYIQVSSRVGRNLSKPGMVVVLYGQSKPRDRSHYERFRPYHQMLYAQVEPTSVTPFSPPAIDRALHGIIVAAIRQMGNLSHEADSPDPFPLESNTKLYKVIYEMIKERVEVVAPEELELVMKKFEERLNEWKVWNPAEYGGFSMATEDAPLIYQAGKSKQPSWGERSWPTVTSLRDVDASCQGDVTSFFNQVSKETI